MREKKHFYIFGSGISFSISPTIHNTAFHYHNLPYAYSIRESPSIDDVRHLIASTKFGAASVTLPHKLQAHKICTSQTETARAIGAINTLTVQSTGIERRIIGDNTDWTGLHAIITTYSVQTAHQPSAGLVIGAGGASRAAVFAMHKSGVRDIYLVNRTSRTAEKVRDDFQALFEVTVVPELADLPRAPEVIISTVPAETTTEEQFAFLFSGSGFVY
ncbi:hypothetical protein BDW59DRAFT_158610 [Aspergillus cavernicola]|uniref:Shikimate dehydrogenase substrate binding N-terminal domain-containing protein n=1 Tax=Aspergillus cavernicola TaxID=176166 RepID=A0ABR4IR89_9EURO